MSEAPTTAIPFDASAAPTRAALLERFFKLSAHGTTVRTEIIAGLTIFATMAYVLAVNPLILSNTGMPLAPLITVTAIAAAVSCIVMGLVTNYPARARPAYGGKRFLHLPGLPRHEDPLAGRARLRLL